ncbi:DUF2946 family protein [Stenotrophomonas sp. JC08]|uniref:DUF2946 family protein n=1 Tax=Stenotrophomonas sp. JC08 TaxID=3445779 RepID=UPI003FA25BD4
MLWLALAATLLMALAPVLSRALQAMPPPGSHAGLVQDHLAHGAGSHHMAGEERLGTPSGPHAAHGEVCDYCTMASRLLPWLAVLLVLLPLCARLSVHPPRATTLPASVRWPAHPPRGPPAFS